MLLRDRNRSLIGSMIAVAALAMPAVAQAQAQSCRMPADFDLPRVSRPDPAQVRRTPVTRYQLALSWSPNHCFTRGQGARDRLQCGGDNGRFGFVLHGLWPETTGRNWPQYCRPPSAVPRAVLAQHLCRTPSADLLQHEWERHGTCMASDPERYFADAARLYDAVRYPPMATLATQRGLTVGAFRRAFASANPGLPVAAITVHQGRGGWLNEVRLCLNIRLRYAACPVASRGAPDGAALRITRPQS